jgi:hypothetical protein
VSRQRYSEFGTGSLSFVIVSRAFGRRLARALEMPPREHAPVVSLDRGSALAGHPFEALAIKYDHATAPHLDQSAVLQRPQAA